MLSQIALMNSSRRHIPDTCDHHVACHEANEKEQAMGHVKGFLIAAPVALGLLFAPAAHAEWRHGGGWGYHGYGHRGFGLPLAAGILGLGVGAAIVASQPPVVAYAPPPAYYPPPGYYPQPYYAAPYYAAPTYGQ
jgi:hypothetical protein